MNVRALVGLLVILASMGVVGLWYNNDVRCRGTLALEGPNSEFAFERNMSAGTLSISHAGGDALLDNNTLTYRWCPEEWEPDVVSIYVDTGTSDGWDQRSLWIARNGSGVGDLPLKKGSSVVLVEPGTKEEGDILLDEPLQDGDEVRLVARRGSDAASYGHYIEEEEHPKIDRPMMSLPDRYLPGRPIDRCRTSIKKRAAFARSIQHEPDRSTTELSEPGCCI